MSYDSFLPTIFPGLSSDQIKYISICVSIVLIILITVIAKKFLKYLTGRIISFKFISANDSSKQLLSKTLLPLVLNVERYIIYFIAFILILKQFNIDTSAILASAGIIGIAVGFGAQNIIKDFISGFFLIFDDLVRVGDVITVGKISGEVEKIDLRNTMVREYGGRLWAIPNGEFRSFGNFNRGFCRAVVEVAIPYEQNMNDAMDALKDVAGGWASEFKEIVLDPPNVQGVMSLNDSSVTLRIVIKVKPQKHWGAGYELKRRVREHFDKKGIKAPYPARVVYNLDKNQ